MENTSYSNAKYLIRFILWLKSIYDKVDSHAKPYVKQLADAARQRLLDEGVIKDPDHDPVVGKYTSYEQGMQQLGLTADTDITPEQKVIQTLQSMGIDTSPLKQIMPSLFTSNTQKGQATLPEQQTIPQTTQQGVSVPTYGKTPTGNITQIGQGNQTSVSAPAGTVPIRNFLKDVYGLNDDNIIWDNTKGLTIKVGDKEFNLGKPRSSDEGQILNGTWYTTPNYVETAMSMNGIQRQKDPIREALPKYLESKGIKGATVDWDKDSNQIILKVGDKTYKLGTPQQVGSLYNGTTYVSQSDIEKALSPIAKDLGIDIGTSTSSDTTQDVTQMTIPEIKLQEEINQAGVMNKTYDQLLQDIQSGEDKLLNQIHDTYQQLITSSLQTMENALKDAKAALEGTKGNYDEYEKTAYQEIEKNVEAAKSKSKEEMAARGIYFSGLTTRALNNIEAQGISEKNKVHMQVLQWKAQIDAQIAIMTANTKMSEAQLQNELMAREALEKLQLIEKDQDKIEAIKQEKALLDAQIEIDKLNLPLENELYRREQEIQNKKDAMDFMEKIFIPMLRLEYEDKWKEESLDIAYMKYQQSVMSFFNDTQEFWAKLGFDEEKFKQTFLWDKEKFAAEMGFKEEQLAAKNSASGGDIPTWVERYKSYITMRPDLLDAMIEKGELIDLTTGEVMKDDKGNPIKITEQDRQKLKAIRETLFSLEPQNRQNFLTSFKSLLDAFGDEGALDFLNFINSADDFPELKALKLIGSTSGSLRNFVEGYLKLYQGYLKGKDEDKKAFLNFVNTFKQETGLDNDGYKMLITFILNWYYHPNTSDETDNTSNTNTSTHNKFVDFILHLFHH